MGKSAPTATTTQTKTALPGWENYLNPALKQYQGQYGSGTGTAYPGQLNAPQNWGQEQSLANMGNLTSLIFGGFGQGNGAGGSVPRNAIGAMNSYLQPGFTDPDQDPYFMRALEQQQGGIAARMGAQGLGAGTSLQNALMQGAAGTMAGEQARRQALQAQMAQYGTQLPMQALQQWGGMAGQAQDAQQQALLRNYMEWQRQQQQGQGGLENLIGYGFGMSPSTTTGTQNSGQGAGVLDVLTSLLPFAKAFGLFGL